MKERVYLFMNDKLLSLSRKVEYKYSNYLETTNLVTNAEALAILKHSFIYDELLTIMIEKDDKKYLGDCSIISVPNESYKDLKEYEIKIEIKNLQEMNNNE